MSGLWHAIWPGWAAVAGQVFVGIITLPIMVAGQLLCMRLISKLRKHVAELADFNQALAEENWSLQRRLERNTQLAKREHRERPDAFQGW